MNTYGADGYKEINEYVQHNGKSASYVLYLFFSSSIIIFLFLLLSRWLNLSRTVSKVCMWSASPVHHAKQRTICYNMH